jgi:hypothetical protein
MTPPSLVPLGHSRVPPRLTPFEAQWFAKPFFLLLSYFLLTLSPITSPPPAISQPLKLLFLSVKVSLKVYSPSTPTLFAPRRDSTAMPRRATPRLRPVWGSNSKRPGGSIVVLVTGRSLPCARSSVAAWRFQIRAIELRGGSGPIRVVGYFPSRTADQPQIRLVPAFPCPRRSRGTSYVARGGLHKYAPVAPPASPHRKRYIKPN